jgi:hypothetical protein
MSHNVDNKVHNGISISCKKCKKCADCKIAKYSDQNFLKRLEVLYKKSYEDFYSLVDSHTNEVKALDWVSHVDNNDRLMPLLYLDSHPKGYQYNGIKIVDHFNLSKNNRIKIQRSADLFNGISIACIDPVTDIKSVTLYACIEAPKKNGDLNVLNYVTKDHNLPFDENNLHHFPLKVIENPQSNYVQFYKLPILLSNLDHFSDLSIGIEYTDTLKVPAGRHNVGLHYTLLNAPFRGEYFKSTKSGLKCVFKNNAQ